jgi:hypothetical protein
MTAMFRQLLRDGQLLEKDEPKFGTAAESAQIWFTYTKLLDSSKPLPTSLHAVSLSWMLEPSEVELPSNLNKLEWEVLGLFKYSQLAFPSDELDLWTLPPEFYRSLGGSRSLGMGRSRSSIATVLGRLVHMGGDWRNIRLYPLGLSFRTYSMQSLTKLDPV